MKTEKLQDLEHKGYEQKIKAFAGYLRQEEKSENTVAKYVRDLRQFYHFLDGNRLTKEMVLSWKEALVAEYAPSSVNSMLAAVNSFLDWENLKEMRVKPLKIQREIFAKPEKELTREEYERLVRAANRKDNQRLALLLQTICATGIRVSELSFITVEALQMGRTMVDCKGKQRVIFLPVNLVRILRNYCKQQGISQGMIFRTRSGKALDRSNIWKEMKALCVCAGVEAGRVFPHNLRHLFARTYYRMEKDLSRLADLLGHANVDTTRIYTMESGLEHARQLGKMGLVVTGI